MTIRVPRRSTIALATAGALASTGTAYLGARSLLVGQATHARTVIPKAWDIPPRADGVYSPGGGPVERWQRGMPVDLHLMIFGDSTATGYGCLSAEEVPGVLIARGLAEQTGKRIRLSTKAIVGATSKGVCGQVDAMFVAGTPPDAAVMMIGANDVTALNGISQSAQRLGTAVRTWKRWLWDLIDDRDFRDAGGDYFRVTEDQATMLPLLEMSGVDRAKHIGEVLMVYNRSSPYACATTRREEMLANCGFIRARPPYRRLAQRPDSNSAIRLLCAQRRDALLRL